MIETSTASICELYFVTAVPVPEGAAGQGPDDDAGQGLREDGQRGAGDMPPSREIRPKHQSCQNPSSTLLRLS